MKAIFVLAESEQGLDEAMDFDGEELIILLPLDKSRIASGFDRHVKRLRTRAQELKSTLKQRGVKARVVVEWGNRNEVVRNASLREYANVINRL